MLGLGLFQTDQRLGLGGGPETGRVTPGEVYSMASACAGLAGAAGSLRVHMYGITSRGR